MGCSSEDMAALGGGLVLGFHCVDTILQLYVVIGCMMHLGMPVCIPLHMCMCVYCLCSALGAHALDDLSRSERLTVYLK